MLHRHFSDKWAYNKRAPKGFRKVGSGASRTAYLDTAEMVVYKIGGSYDNLDDASMSRVFRRRSTKRLPFNLYIPRTRTYAVGYDEDNERDYVAVQEFAANCRPTHCNLFYGYMRPTRCTCRRGINCHAEPLKAIKEWSQLYDIHGENVLWNEKTRTYWLIDLAC